MGRLANLQTVPFAKRKPGRGPLQRLSDSRRSLALGGLALGVVFSAGFFRRKRRPAEVEFQRPAPAPSAPTQSGPPVAVEVPPVASGLAAGGPVAAVAPETAASAGPTGTPSTAEAPTEGSGSADADSAINADAVPSEPEPEVDPAPTEPATGELSAEEASILAVLAQSGRADEDRTAIAVATSLERETTDVASVLRKLNSEGVVSGDLYTASGDKIWAVTERGVRRLGAQH